MARCVQSSAHRAGVKIQPRGEGGGAWVCVDVVLFLQDVREEEGARLMPWGGTAPSDGGVDSCEEEQAKAAHRGGQRQARLWGGEGEPQRRLGSPALGDEGYRIDGAEDSEFRPLSWPWRPTQWTGMCGRTKARAASSIGRPWSVPAPHRGRWGTLDLRWGAGTQGERPGRGRSPQRWKPLAPPDAS